MGKFLIKNLGNGLGDCFIVEIANEKEKCVILVDGHRENQSEETFLIIKENIGLYDKIDIIVVTHIDDDHIGGIVKLLELPENDEVAQKIKDANIIYNNVISPLVNYEQARKLEGLVSTRSVINTCKKDYNIYNNSFLKILSYKKREMFDPEEYDDYKNNPIMTLIHPINISEVEKIRNDYNNKLNSDGTLGKPNAKLLNQYSIVFLLEFMRKRVLFAADSSIVDISDNVMKLKNIVDSVDVETNKNQENEFTRKVHLIKIPHHGAAENNNGLIKLTRKSLCKCFLVTGEKVWNERHPAKSLLNDLYSELSNELRIFTKIDMGEYQYRSEVIRSDVEINILEIE